MVYRKCPCCKMNFYVDDGKCWKCQISVVAMADIREEFPRIYEAELQKLRANSPTSTPMSLDNSFDLSQPLTRSSSTHHSSLFAQSLLEEENRIINSSAQARAMAQGPRVLDNNDKKRQRGSTSTLYSLPVLPQDCVR